MIEQSASTRRKILGANIPPRLRGLSLLPDEERLLEGFEQRPPGATSDWSENVLSGLVVAAVGQYETCGRGLWATGSGAGTYLTALMRDLLVQGPFRGLYLSVDEYLESMRPDNERKWADRVVSDDIVLLANTGTEQMTEWTRATVRSLILKRWDKGLPTLVSATCEPSEYLPDTLAEEIFSRVGIMRLPSE